MDIKFKKRKKNFLPLNSFICALFSLKTELILAFFLKRLNSNRILIPSDAVFPHLRMENELNKNSISFTNFYNYLPNHRIIL